MQPHDLHEHLVTVGRAIKRAGARPVVGLCFSLQQGRAIYFTFCVLLPQPGLLIIGQATGHRPGGDKRDG